MTSLGGVITDSILMAIFVVFNRRKFAYPHPSTPPYLSQSLFLFQSIYTTTTMYCIFFQRPNGKLSSFPGEKIRCRVESCQEKVSIQNYEWHLNKYHPNKNAKDKRA